MVSTLKKLLISGLLLLGCSFASAQTLPLAAGGTGATNAPGALTNMGIIQAAAYTGSDCGAKIQAADTAWAGTPVEIDVTQACGTTFSTTFTLSVGHNLKFTEGGTYVLLQGNIVSGTNAVTGIGQQVILQLAANQTGGMFQFVNGSSAASYVTFYNMTWDGNQSNAPSTCSSSTYNCAFGAYINSSSSQAPNHIVFDHMTFQNFYGFPIWIYEGTAGYPEASYIWVEHSLFNNTKKEAIKSYGFAGHIHIIDNDFWNYGNLGGGNYDAIYWADTLTASCGGATSLSQDWDIEQNRFYNTSGETKFATELYGGTLLCSVVDGVKYINNYADGEGFAGGIGVSSGSIHADISHNTFKNCTGSNDRCGIESWTQHSTINSNTLDEGAIQLYPSGVTGSVFTDVTVADNTINNAQDNGVGAAPILLTTGAAASSTTSNVTITGNNIDMTNSPCTNNATAILIGANSSTSTMSQINVHGGNILVCNGTGGNGIRIATTTGGSTSNVTITGVNIKGAGASSENGILDSDTTSVDSDIRIHGNHLISFINPLNISLPSADWDAWGNDTSPTGQGFNSINGYQANGLQVITGSGVVLPSITSPWSPYYRGTVTGSITTGRWSPPQTEIVTQVEYSLETAPVGCSATPFVEIFDYTVNAPVAGADVNVVGLTGISGTLNIPLVAGHIYAAGLTTNGATCSTYPANPQLTVQLRNVLAAPVATRTAFYAGSTTATEFGSFVGSGETLTQIDVTPQVAPLTCSPFPTINLYDYTATAAVSGTTVTLASAAFYNTSGVISVATILGHNYGWVFTQGTGCGTNVTAPTVTAQFTGGYEVWNNYSHLTPSSGTVTFGTFTPQSNLFVSGLGVSLETSAVGCSVAPVVQIFDNTASAVVSGASATIANSTPQTWVPNQAGYLTAGHQYELQLTEGSGCSTEPSSPDVSVQFNVNTGNLVANNNLADVQNPAKALQNLGGQAALTLPLVPSQGGVGASTSASFFLRNFGNGADGALTVSSGTTNVGGAERWYTSVTVSSGAILANTNTSAPFIIRSTGTCTIAGTISVSPNTGSAAGNALGVTAVGGGTGGGGGGGAAAGTAGTGGNVIAGGTLGASSGGGGGNGNQTSSSAYRPILSTGLIYPAVTSDIYGGSGGGTGGSSGPTGGKGGGGALILICPTISFTGTVDASGVAGSVSTGNNIGASGGGGGGFVVMSAETYSANTGTINVAGGSGGGCSSFTGCGTGGNGASGNSIQLTIQ